jgi:hypothetical protein
MSVIVSYYGRKGQIVMSAMSRIPPFLTLAARASRKPALAIEPVAQLLAGFEKWRPFFFNMDRLAAAWIAADPGRAVLDRIGAKTAKLDPIAARQRVGNLVKDDGNNAFDVAMEQIRVLIGEFLHQF